MLSAPNVKQHRKRLRRRRRLDEALAANSAEAAKLQRRATAMVAVPENKLRQFSLGGKPT